MLKIMQGSEEINSNGGFSFVKRLLDGNQAMKQGEGLLLPKHNTLYSTSSTVRVMEWTAFLQTAQREGCG